MSLFWMNKLVDKSESSSGVKIKWHQLQPLPKSRTLVSFYLNNGKTKRTSTENKKYACYILNFHTEKYTLSDTRIRPRTVHCKQHSSKVLNTFFFLATNPTAERGVWRDYRPKGFLFLSGIAKICPWKNLVHWSVISLISLSSKFLFYVTPEKSWKA